MRHALVTLYAATTRDTPQGTSASVDDASSRTALTDDEGNFTIPYGYQCPTLDAQMYLVSRGGNAGGGINPNLVLMSALGPCAKLDASRFIVNEATTVAAVYVLSSFMTDAEHVGSASASPSGVAAAFATAHDLVDVTTGLVLARTVSGTGLTPQTKIDHLANAVGACAITAGSTLADASACDQFFRATNSGPTPASQANDTSQALLDLAHHATGFGGGFGSVTAVFALGATAPSFSHGLSSPPKDWTLSIQFPKELQSVSGDVGTEPFVDSAGNVWIRSGGLGVVEFVGAKPYAQQANALISGTANTGSEP